VFSPDIIFIFIFNFSPYFEILLEKMSTFSPAFSKSKVGLKLNKNYVGTKLVKPAFCRD
jgi:hypothetical protein